MKDKAQTISTDALIAIALFLIAVTLFFTLSADSGDEKRVGDLQTESGRLSSSLSSSKNESQRFVEGSSFIQGSKVDQKTLGEIAKLNYSQLKNKFGANSEFCIYFEDEEGNLINISGNKTGLGSAYVTVGEAACG